MKRRYCFGAAGENGDHHNGEVEAETIDDALGMARDRARQRLGGGAVRITTITEEVDLAVSGPIARALSVDFNPRFLG